MFIYQTNRRDQYYEKVIDLYVNKHLSSRRIAKIASDNPKVPIMSKKTVKPKEMFSEPESRQELPDDEKAISVKKLRIYNFFYYLCAEY